MVGTKNMEEKVPGHFQSKSITLGPDIKGEITLEINYQRSIRCCMKATWAWDDALNQAKSK